MTDTRREDVSVEAIARVLHSRDVTADDLPEGSWQNAAVRYRYRSMAEAVLAALPAPPVVDEALTETIARAIDTFAFIDVSAAHDPRTESEQRGRRECAFQAAERVLAVLPAPPMVDERTECGRCEQVRPVAWTDDDLVTYCEECVNAFMTDLHADLARAPVVDEAEIQRIVAQVAARTAHLSGVSVGWTYEVATAVAARLRGATRGDDD